MNHIHMLITYIILHRTVGYTTVRIIEESLKYLAWSSLYGVYYGITYFIPKKPELFKTAPLDEFDFMTEEEENDFILIKTS